MCAIDDNGWFRHDLNGYGIEGNIVARQSVRSLDAHLFFSVKGSNFAVLDYVPVDIDGERASGLRDPAETDFITYRDTNRNNTIGADGAIISCHNVHLSAGDQIYFTWAFLGFDASPYNDFACFYAYPGNGSLRNAIAVKNYVKNEFLSDVLTLENRRVNYTDWTTTGWRAEADFDGTVCWVVSNGQSLSNPAATRTSGRAFARPSALLLDHIHIHPRE